MNPYIRKVTVISGIVFLIGSLALHGQILRDSSTLVIIRQDIDLLYNFKFNDARNLSDEFIRHYPDHPIVNLISGLTTYWENYPLLQKSDFQESFENDMRKCIELSENKRDSANEAEYLLASLCARGMLLTFYSDNDMIADVIPLAISTYKPLRSSFEYTSSCTDLLFFTGLYNYYREAYPKEYPVYKSLALLFPEGNTETGIKQLKTSASGSVVLSPESYYLLSWIYLNFENNYSESLHFSRTLHEKYPDNDLYKATFIKNLLLIGKYDEAESLFSESSGSDNGSYLSAQLSVFKAILQEKKYKNPALAEELYNIGIHNLSDFGSYANEYIAYGYYGLSRISKSRGENHTAKIYRNQAEKHAEFKKISFDR